MKRLVVMAALLLAFNANAKMGLYKKFKVAYPDSPTVEASCMICHTNEEDFELNSYGQDLGSHDMNFKEIEELDSDVDGYTNIAEIMAGFLPGNIESHPEPKVEPTPPVEPIPE